MSDTTIHWSHSPTGGQSLDATLVTNRHGRTFRVTLHWDRSYAVQTRGEIAVLKDGSFETLLHLHHHDMTRFVAYDLSQPQARGEFDRAGRLPDLLHRQADALAELGARILGLVPRK